MVVIILAIIIFCVYRNFCKLHDTKTPAEISMEQFIAQIEKFDVPAEDNGMFKMMNEQYLTYIIPEHSGYINEMNGAFTIRRFIPDSVLLNCFPQKTGEYFYLPVCKSFPNGETVEITDIIKGDSLIMYKFVRKESTEILQDVSLMIDSLLKEINK